MSNQNKFYVGYNTLTKEVLQDTMYRYKADTVDILNSMFGTNWETERPHLSVQQCEVVINASESKG